MTEQQQAPPPPAGGPDPDHNLAFWAHLAGGILCLFCIGALVAWIPGLVIFITNKEKSKFVAFHALQATILHGAAAVITFMLWGAGLVGLFLLTLPLAFLINIGVFVYSLITAMKAKEGQWAEYVMIGEFVRGQVGGQEQ